MQITFTEAALHETKRRLGDEPYRLKLVYDSEGCGCAVSGVPTLWAENSETKPSVHPESKAEANAPFPVVFEQRHEVFFEERMTVDYQPAKHAYMLKSGSQIYNGTMKVLDKRSAVRQH
ncbi:iron-sulfur cluster biosynthesis family protein [Paenibacillus sp. MBLB4367]|uniref:iron-sulfur cluster biosynthesis family protein n=1 Tax=Paenibacillus sp. MBLB4367 TaxID=3384767 RepID=UPI003908119B